MNSVKFVVLFFALALTVACQDDQTKREGRLGTPELEEPGFTSTVSALPTPLSRSTQTPPPATPAPELVQATPTPTPPPLAGHISLSGIIAVAIGDPQGGSGPARQAARIADATGKVWRLVFDDNVFRAPASLFDWNLKRVNVEGTLTGEADTVLVTFITLAPP